MPDTFQTEATPIRPMGSLVFRATGWLTTLVAGEDCYQHTYDERWHDALNTYDDPPRGWRAVAISACIDGVPVAKLDAHTIADLRRAVA